jgi:hypothetical protein
MMKKSVVVLLMIGLVLSLGAMIPGFVVISRENDYIATHRLTVSVAALSADLKDLGEGLVVLGLAGAAICIALLLHGWHVAVARWTELGVNRRSRQVPS